MADGLIPVNGRTAWTIRGLELVGSIVAAVLVAYIFIDQRYDDIETRLTQIESNRFTSTDGAEIWKALNKVPPEIPPVWFLERVDDIESRLRIMEGKR